MVYNREDWEKGLQEQQIRSEFLHVKCSKGFEFWCLYMHGYSCHSYTHDYHMKGEGKGKKLTHDSHYHHHYHMSHDLFLKKQRLLNIINTWFCGLQMWHMIYIHFSPPKLKCRTNQRVDQRQIYLRLSLFWFSSSGAHHITSHTLWCCTELVNVQHNSNTSWKDLCYLAENLWEILHRWVS